MGRRSGLVILLAAVLVPTVSVHTRPVDGSAAAVPVPGPPAVGDCASAPAGEYPAYGDAAAAGYVYPQTPMLPCTGPRFADVVAVFTSWQQPTVQFDGSSMFVDDPNQSRCSTAVLGYVGQTASTDPAGTSWFPVASFRASLSRPSVLQEAAGQHWLACLVAATGPADPQLGPSPSGGTLLDGIHTGIARDASGACPVGGNPDAGTAPGGCAVPHTVQVLAVAAGRPGSSHEAVTAGCRWAATRLTGLADVTAGGSLSLSVRITDDHGAPVADGTVPAGSGIRCVLGSVDGRTLSGGLIGLGDRPLPWT